MKHTSDEIQFVPYIQSGEPPRRAGLVRVDVNLDGLSDREIQVMGHLAEAANSMNPVYRDQFETKTPMIRRLVHRLMDVANEEERTALKNYSTLLDLQNSPFSFLPRKNHLLALDTCTVEKLIVKCKDSQIQRDYEIAAPFLFEGLELPDRAGFYPPDITDDELKALGNKASLVNSSVKRDKRGLSVHLNEELYRKDLEPVIGHLRRAREFTDEPSFQLYLDAKIEELSFGTTEARRLADYTWVRHTSKLDLILGSAIEVYLDNWKNARGAAAGAALIENSAATEQLQALIDRYEEFEATAPWKHKKLEINPETLPNLKFVDVLSWAGDYVNGPMTIIAQSLPNDDWVIQKIGSVNMVYYNTGKAIHKVSGKLAAKEFLPARTFDKLGSLLFDASQLHSALHELGHTTGMMDPQHRDKLPREYFEAEFSPLEEARAELFGLWAMPLLAKEGVITADLLQAGYTGMLLSMLQSLKFEPKQAHNMARNMMWHYFLSNGAISVTEEDGKKKYETNPVKIHDVTAQMLQIIGDMKASGDKSHALEFRKKWCYDDELRPVIEERTKDFPLGRGLIFPKLKKDGDRFTRELVYPDSFSAQDKFARELIV